MNSGGSSMGHAGFSLIETLIGLLLSGILLMFVMDTSSLSFKMQKGTQYTDTLDQTVQRLRGYISSSGTCVLTLEDQNPATARVTIQGNSPVVMYDPATGGVMFQEGSQILPGQGLRAQYQITRFRYDNVRNISNAMMAADISMTATRLNENQTLASAAAGSDTLGPPVVTRVFPVTIVKVVPTVLPQGQIARCFGDFDIEEACSAAGGTMVNKECILDVTKLKVEGIAPIPGETLPMQMSKVLCDINVNLCQPADKLSGPPAPNQPHSKYDCRRQPGGVHAGTLCQLPAPCPSGWFGPVAGPPAAPAGKANCL